MWLSSQPDDADASFRKAIALSQDKFGEADIALGTLLLNKNDNAGGEKLIRTGIGLRPNSGMGYFELGRACSMKIGLPRRKTPRRKPAPLLRIRRLSTGYSQMSIFARKIILHCSPILTLTLSWTRIARRACARDNCEIK